MKKIISLLIVCAMIISMFAISAFAAEPVNDWICEDDGSVGIWVKEPTKESKVEGAAFNASGEWSSIVFKTIWGSSLNNEPDEDGNTTLDWSARVTIYAYDTSYAKSIKGTPLATKDFDGSGNLGYKYKDESGNEQTKAEGVEFKFDKTFGAGKYVFTFEGLTNPEATGTNRYWVVLPKCSFMATDLLKAEFGNASFGFGVKFTDGGKLLNMDEDPEKIKEAEEEAEAQKAEKAREEKFGNTPLFDDSEGAESSTGWWIRENAIAEDYFIDVSFTAEKWFSGVKAFLYASSENKPLIRVDLKDLDEEILASKELVLCGDGWYTIDFGTQIEPGSYIVEFVVAEDFEAESCYFVLGSADPIEGIDEDEITVDFLGASTNEKTLEAPRMYLLNCEEGTPGEKPTEAPTEAPTEVPTEAPTEAPTAEPTAAPTAEPEKQSGCKSVIGSAAVLMAAAGIALVMRKKEN